MIGCAVARELGQRGVAVTVVERGQPGRAASWAAAGMLAPVSEALHAPALFPFGSASFDEYPGLADALREETGLDVQYRRDGCLHVALSDDDLPEIEALAEAAGSSAERVNARDVRTLEPALTPDLAGALLVHRAHQVENRLLSRALWLAAAGRGVEFRNGETVAAVVLEGDRVAGVRLASGERLSAPWVVVAAGAWSAHLMGLPAPLPIRPVRGQMFAVHAAPAPLHRFVWAPGCYLVPRADGRLLVGATAEEVGFRPGPTPAGLAVLAHAAVRAVPGVGGLPVLESWYGFRPGTPDNLPILGEDPEVPGLVYATGHFRNGILLAPLTALCIADLVTGEVPRQSLARFAPQRFRAEAPGGA